MKTAFLKMHGCGNDFVVIDGRRRAFTVKGDTASSLADRHTGIGFDQLIVIERSTHPDTAAFLRFLNPDGSEAGACGNATRCVADLLMRERGTDKVALGTVSGNLSAVRRDGGMIEVDMGQPGLNWADIPLASVQDTVKLGMPGDPAAASMGNPHATFFVDDVDVVSIEECGPALEHHPMFPDRANIGFAQIINRSTIRLRVWERGAGLTLACGSGACAALVNAHRRGLAHRMAKIILDGGTLSIEWRGDGHVFMTGPVAYVYAGEFESA